MRKNSFFLLLFSLFLVQAHSQQLNIPLSPLFEQQYLFKANKDKGSFTGLKPLLDSRIQSVNYDSIVYYKEKGTSRKNWFLRKVFSESFIVVDTGDFKLAIDPLINVASGKGFSDDDTSKLFNNSRGLLVRGDIGEKFSFETSFLETQSFLPKYLSAFVKANDVSPGQGRVKTFKTTGYDFAYGTGYISWSPARSFNLQLGHGKHFVGEGYRSLLLSDNAFNYPFIKSSYQNKWIKYDVIYSSLMVVKNGRLFTSAATEGIFRKKPGTFHLLSLKPIPQVEIGFFEATIFQSERPGKAEDWSFINPIIFLNTARFGLNHTNNVVMGVTGSIKPIPSLTAYGQYAIDGNGGFKKGGVQGGVRFQTNLLHVRAEFNKVNSYTYSATDAFQSYSHYNQPLAHPWGAGFSELHGSAGVKLFQRLFLRGMVTYGRYSALPYGRDVQLSDTIITATLIDAAEIKFLFVSGAVEYVFNRVTNLSVFGELSLRKEDSVPLFTSNTGFIYFGVRTNLWNTYRDF